jgi:hypothetical protein
MLTREEIITGDKFKEICDDYIDESKPFIDLKLKPKNIFCFTDWINLFVNKILPNIDYEFKFVTHNADKAIDQTNSSVLLNDKRLIHWYGMNCHIEHNKLTPIPIGIANEKWSHGNKNILLKVASENLNKQNRIYCNFNPNTTYRRNNLIDILKQYDFVDIETCHLSFEDYLRKLKSYKYVISPPGNSIDCHRIWESIYLNTVPIILKNIATDTFSENLPIITLKTYSNLDLKELESLHNLVSDRKLEMSNFNYYKKTI